MAKKITELTAASPLSGTEPVPVVQGGETRKTTAQAIANLAAGGVTSVNTLTGAVSLQVGDGTLGGTATNKLVWLNAAGDLDVFTSWGVDPTYLGLNVGRDQPVINDGYHNWNFLRLSLDPTIASPTATWAHTSHQIEIDPNATGFSLGTSGSAATFYAMSYDHQGTSSTGYLNYLVMAGTIGNGTDPVTVGGLLGASIYPQLLAGVTTSGQVGGYSFSLTCNAATVFGASSWINVFSDTANLPTALTSYTSFHSSPIIGSIANNHSYAGLNLNPTITTLTGNAGVILANLSGTFGTLGTNGFTGINVNPTITSLNQPTTMISVQGQTTAGTADWTAINIGTTSVNTSGAVRGLVINVPDNLTDVAMEITGHTNMSSNFDVVSGQGQQYGNVIGGTMTIPNNATVTGTDVLADSMAFTVHTGNASSTWTTASIVGLTTLGFVGLITGDGQINGDINFCLNGYSDQHNGHINRVNNFNAASIPGGGTGTMDEAVLYYGQQPFGPVATNNWGIRIDTAGLENYLPSLAISTSNKKVTNASVGIEIGGELQALLLSRLTTTQKNALTAVNGMLVYDLTLGKFQGYEAGTWTNLI